LTPTTPASIACLDRLPDGLGQLVERAAVAALDIGVDRHLYRARDAMGRVDHFDARHRLAVGIAERDGDTAAGSRDRGEARNLEDPRARRIPRVRQNQGAGPRVQPQEARRPFLLCLGNRRHC
jgi:hypothetical protein